MPGAVALTASTTQMIPQPSDLDEPWPYMFQVSGVAILRHHFIDGSYQAGDRVWIRTAGGNWHPGKVSGQTTRKGQTREVGQIHHCHHISSD